MTYIILQSALPAGGGPRHPHPHPQPHPHPFPGPGTHVPPWIWHLPPNHNENPAEPGFPPLTQTQQNPETCYTPQPFPLPHPETVYNPCGTWWLPFQPPIIGAGGHHQLEDLHWTRGDRNGRLHVRLHAGLFGRLSLATTDELTFEVGDGDDDLEMTFTGEPKAIEAALAKITFHANPNIQGVSALTLQSAPEDAADGETGLTSDITLAVNIDAANENDPPVVLAPENLYANEDQLIDLRGVLITDADDEILRAVELSASHGSFLLPAVAGISITTTSTGNVTLSGSLTAINVALRNGFYLPAPEYSGADEIIVTGKDAGATAGSGQTEVTIQAVNDPPSVSTPDAIELSEDESKSLDLGLNDPDAGGVLMNITLRVPVGNLKIDQPAPAKLTALSPGLLRLRGTLASLQAAVPRVEFVPPPDYFGETELDFQLTDNGGTGAGGPRSTSGSLLLAVLPVNDPPVIDLNGCEREGSGWSRIYRPGAAPVALADASSSVADVDNTELAEVTVRLVGAVDGAAETIACQTDNTGLTQTWDAAAQRLTISGIAASSVYTQVLRSLTYCNSSPHATPTYAPGGDLANARLRTVEVRASDGVAKTTPAVAVIGVQLGNAARHWDAFE